MCSEILLFMLILYWTRLYDAKRSRRKLIPWINERSSNDSRILVEINKILFLFTDSLEKLFTLLAAGDSSDNLRNFSEIVFCTRHCYDQEGKDLLKKRVQEACKSSALDGAVTELLENFFMLSEIGKGNFSRYDQRVKPMQQETRKNQELVGYITNLARGMMCYHRWVVCTRINTVIKKIQAKQKRKTPDSESDVCSSNQKKCKQ